MSQKDDIPTEELKQESETELLLQGFSLHFDKFLLIQGWSTVFVVPFSFPFLSFQPVISAQFLLLLVLLQPWYIQLLQRSILVEITPSPQSLSILHWYRLTQYQM